MKFLIVCLAIAGCASAGLLPHHPHQSNDAAAQTVSLRADIQPDGHYENAFQTDNGISAQEAGLGGKSVQGSYSYTAPDGTPVQIQYVADENGFQPQGNLLPVAPPVPEHVTRALAWIAAHPQQPEPLRAVPQFAPVAQRVATPFTFTQPKPAFTPFRFN